MFDISFTLRVEAGRISTGLRGGASAENRQGNPLGLRISTKRIQDDQRLGQTSTLFEKDISLLELYQDDDIYGVSTSRLDRGLRLLNLLGCDCVCVKVLCPVLLSGTGLVFLLRTGGSPGQWYNATRISAMHD